MTLSVVNKFQITKSKLQINHKCPIHKIPNEQLIKSSGSIGANYREANEALSKKDFLMRVKISRKEAKESHYWLRLSHETKRLQNDDEAKRLIQEANELKKIFSAIAEKSK